MNEVKCDTALCVRCGTCVRTCPVGVLALRPDSVPSVPEEMRSRCLSCGQCEAVCPKGAVTVAGPRLEPPLWPMDAAPISPAQLGAYFRNRRSVRRYKPEPVDDQTLEQLFDIVRYAPSGMNGQPVRWIVVRSPDEVRRIAGAVVEWMRGMIAADAPVARALPFAGLVSAWDAGIDPINHGAPHLAIACAHRDARIAPVDGVIALAHAELAAPAFGLGACWAGFVKVAADLSPDGIRELGLPDDHVCIGGLMLGYPAVTYRRVPRRSRAVITWR